VGITTGEVTFAHPTFHRPEGTLLCSRNALPEDFTSIIAAIERGEVRTDPWVTHRAAFGEMIAAFPSFVRPEMMADQRPVLDWKDARLVRPLLRELALLVHERIQSRAVVRPQSRERDLIMRRQQYAHGIDLQQPDLPEQATQMSRVHHTGRPRAVEALRGERDTPCFAERERVPARHRGRVTREASRAGQRCRKRHARARAGSSCVQREVRGPEQRRDRLSVSIHPPAEHGDEPAA